jgi:hypothetical protein
MAHLNSYTVNQSPTYIVLYNFKDFIYREVVSRLQSSVLTAPRQRCSLLAIRLELEQAVIDAVEQHFVVDVFALRKQNL